MTATPAPAVQDSTPLANGPGVGKASVEVNYDPPRSLEERNATDTAAEGIDPSSASAASTNSAGLSRTSPEVPDA